MRGTRRNGRTPRRSARRSAKPWRAGGVRRAQRCRCWRRCTCWCWASSSLPACYVVWLSLTASTFGQAPTFVGLANYAHVLADPYFWRALRNTIVVVLIVVHVELLLGLGMALLFASGLPARRCLLAAVLAPYAVSEVSAVVMWRFLFDPDVGPVTIALHGARPADRWTGRSSPRTGCSWSRCCRSGCTCRSPSSSCTRRGWRSRRELYEAARIDGATPLADLPPRHAAAAGAGDPGRDAVPLHLRLPPVLRGLAADAGRAGAHDRGASPSISISRPSASTPSAPRRRPAGSWWWSRCCWRAGYLWGLRREMATDAH